MSNFARVIRKNQGDKRRRTAKRYYDKETGRLNLKRRRVVVVKNDGSGRKVRLHAMAPSPFLVTGSPHWRERFADAVDRRAAKEPAPRRGSLWGELAGHPPASEVRKRIAIRQAVREIVNRREGRR